MRGGNAREGSVGWSWRGGGVRDVRKGGRVVGGSMKTRMEEDWLRKVEIMKEQKRKCR